jgi:hypothetical protein
VTLLFLFLSPALMLSSAESNATLAVVFGNVGILGDFLDKFSFGHGASLVWLWVDGYQVDVKRFQPSVTSTIFPMFFRASIYT